MEIKPRQANQRDKQRHARPTIADPICPICGRVRLVNYQMILQANPNLALRRVERVCDCTATVRPSTLAQLVVFTAFLRQFAVAAVGHRRRTISEHTGSADRRLSHR